jgi:hypothetical protein
MAMIEGTLRLKTAQAEYDFAVDGGATGTITLRGVPGDSHGNSIPSGAVITGGYIDVETAVASGTGTVALAGEGAADLLAATGAAGLTTGRKDIVPDSTGSTAVKTTAVRSVTMTIATAALTAGKFRVVVFYK